MISLNGRRQCSRTSYWELSIHLYIGIKRRCGYGGRKLYLPKFAYNIIQAIKIGLFQPHGTLQKLLTYKVPPNALCLSLKLFCYRLLTRIILKSTIYYSFLTSYCAIFETSVIKLFWNRLLTRIILKNIIYYSILSSYCALFETPIMNQLNIFSSLATNHMRCGISV